MSSFFRKRVRGLLKTTFSAPGSVGTESITGRFPENECTNDENEIPIADGKTRNRCGQNGPHSSSTLIYERILNGNGRRSEDNSPEVYSGKTGLDLPIIHVGHFSSTVKASYTGPDGGLTKVQQIRSTKNTVARMANIDDELSLSSVDDELLDAETSLSAKCAENGNRKKLRIPNPERSNSMEALGFTAEDLIPSTSTSSFDWSAWNENRAYGLSISLYERHPITGVSSGTPIADVFGIIARENNAILALADGVNWGEGARLAARCAVRGALDHLNAAIEHSEFETTKDVFHCLLMAFHTSHTLILQEGGALTTLCVAVVAPVKNSDSSVLCVCNVGDSLAFVYSSKHGVSEVTKASHDIGQMRDMRDAGGALGPVDGRNPQLQNLTCSMTFLEQGDLVFITSDGITDNFDPVVGKFCAAKKTERKSDQHPDMDPFMGTNINETTKTSFHKTKSAPNNAALAEIPASMVSSAICTQIPPMATLACVDSFERHELMLLRMADVIVNGLNGCSRFSAPKQTRNNKSLYNGIESTIQSWDDEQHPSVTAADLCKNLIHFSYQLTNAKRRALEDPELYRSRTHSKTEERLRRKMIRNMILEMPGKLDHASVVAFLVGNWIDSSTSSNMEYLQQDQCEHENGINAEGGEPRSNELRKELTRINEDSEVYAKIQSDKEFKIKESNLIERNPPDKNIITPSGADGNAIIARKDLHLDLIDITHGINEQFNSPNESPIHYRHNTKSPYEDLPIGFEEKISSGSSASTNHPINKQSKRHARGSQGRHTLGVDVTWLKRLVQSKTPANQQFSEGPNKNLTPTEDPPTQEAIKEAEVATSFNKLVSSDVQSESQSPISSFCINRYQPCRGSSGNFSLKKLKTLIRQTCASDANGEISCSPGHNTINQPPITPNIVRNSVPLLGVSALKTPSASASVRRPTSTRV